MPDVIDTLKDAHRNATPPTPFDLDDPIRRGRRRRHRRRVASVGAGVAVAASAVAAALVLPGASSESPESPEPAVRPTFGVLDEPQREEDQLPPSVLQQARVDESSTRLIGEYEGLAYWLATGEMGDFCVVAAEHGAWLGTGCGGLPPVVPPNLAESTGLLAMGHGFTESGFGHAHVFPDGVELEIAGHAGLVFLSDNLGIRSISEHRRQELVGVLESAAEHFSAFGARQKPSDLLPEARNRPNWPFGDAVTRYVGEYRDVRYWMGAVEDGPPEEHRQICLIGVTGGGEWRGTTCSDPLDLSGGGPRWPLERTDPEDSTRLALVPDDYELTDEQSGTWERVAPNLYHDTAAE